MELLFFFYVAVFYLGAILGSFLNVVCLDLMKLFKENDLENRAELPFFTKHITQGYFWQSVMKRRSHCDTCDRDLYAHELFPLLSYTAQMGKCRSCKTPITSSHFWVELASGIYFVGIFHVLFNNFSTFSAEFIWAVIFWFITFGLLFVIALFDLRTQLIPNILLVLAYILLVANMFVTYPLGIVVPEWQNVAAALLFASLFFATWVVSAGRWIGFADAKLVALFGLLFGFSAGFTGIAVSFWAGAGISLLLIGIQKMRKQQNLTMQSAVPFGPFLVFGMWFVFVSGINLFSLVI